jgi:hypothetical protein
MDREIDEIKNEVIKICWYMRGGVTMTEAWDLDISDKKIIGNLIKENLDTTKKSGLPFF